MSACAGKVLVVDDDDAIRGMVERVLRREQFDVESARDGAEAIEKLSRSEYAAVVLDLMMPRVDGHGVLRFVERELAQPRPAVILMSADVQRAQAAACADSVTSVITKPFEIRDLIAEVRDCMTSASARNPAESA